MNYGSDFYLDEEGDIVFRADGDIQIEDKERLIVQDLREEASILYGSVPWDKEAGSHFIEMLNDAGFQDDDAIGELERLALKDPRIDASSVLAFKDSGGRFQLRFTPLGNLPEKTLYFDLDKILYKRRAG